MRRNRHKSIEIIHTLGGNLFLVICLLLCANCTSFSNSKLNGLKGGNTLKRKTGQKYVVYASTVFNADSKSVLTPYVPQICTNAWESLESCEGGNSLSEITTVSQLTSEIQRTLRFDSPLRKQTEVKRAMMRSSVPTESFLPYAFWNSELPYTRNLVATDKKTFVLLLLCWSPRQVSKIHDHPCDGCWMQVIDGTVEEKVYKKDGRVLAEVSTHLYEKEEVAFVDDYIGFHSVGNPFERPAMTLHLYSPPFASCRAWPDATDATVVCHPKMDCYHSEYGKPK